MDQEKLINEINKLKKAKNAIILAHYYQNDEIQAIADYVGDSYQLSVLAKNTKADIIIFCGVHFMAETAKILSPLKKVYLPVKNAGCFMADTISYDDLKKYKAQNPNKIIIGYVNTSAKVKSLCDVCVTSSNAVKVFEAYKDREILYLPDQNLAIYANKKFGYHLDYWHGCCDVHHQLTIKDVNNMRLKYPNACLIVHPEAPYDVLNEADYVGSTKGMLDFVKHSEKHEFIIGTEKGILYQLKKDYPDKKFYLLNERLECKTMKATTLLDVYQVLTLDPKGRYEEIIIDDETLTKARKALDEMLKY